MSTKKKKQVKWYWEHAISIFHLSLVVFDRVLGILFSFKLELPQISFYSIFQSFVYYEKNI